MLEYLVAVDLSNRRKRVWGFENPLLSLPRIGKSEVTERLVVLLDKSTKTFEYTIYYRHIICFFLIKVVYL